MFLVSETQAGLILSFIHVSFNQAIQAFCRLRATAQHWHHNGKLNLKGPALMDPTHPLWGRQTWLYKFTWVGNTDNIYKNCHLVSAHYVLGSVQGTHLTTISN